MTLSPMQAQMCEQQGRLFESLNARGIDPKAFIRAYLNSQAAKGLDAPYNRMQWAGEEYIFEEVVDEFGLTASPDAPKCNPEALYYAGYITRYWHYKTGESSAEIYRQADETRLLGAYGLHVEDNDLAVEDMRAR